MKGYRYSGRAKRMGWKTRTQGVMNNYSLALPIITALLMGFETRKHKRLGKEVK